jgi:NAD(P)-dependent dehydrogenase (short-subunit alcohol dehydrogenase family)
MNIEKKTVLITGANHGIGRALVNEALTRGAERFMGAHFPEVLVLYPKRPPEAAATYWTIVSAISCFDLSPLGG